MKNKFRLRGSSWLHSIYSGDRIQLITSRLRSFSLLIVLSPGSSPGSCLRGPWPGLGWLPCLYCYHCSVVQFSSVFRPSWARLWPGPPRLVSPVVAPHRPTVSPTPAVDFRETSSAGRRLTPLLLPLHHQLHQRASSARQLPNIPGLIVRNGQTRRALWWFLILQVVWWPDLSTW